MFSRSKLLLFEFDIFKICVDSPDSQNLDFIYSLFIHYFKKNSLIYITLLYIKFSFVNNLTTFIIFIKELSVRHKQIYDFFSDDATVRESK